MQMNELCIYPTDDGTDFITVELHNGDMSVLLNCSKAELVKMRDNLTAFINDLSLEEQE